MTAKIIDGKAIAEQNLNKLKKEIIERENEGIRPPCLAVILVGDDPASSIYVNKKKSACENVGIKSVSHQLPSDTTQSYLNNLINTLNQDKDVDGILVQSPLPKHLDEDLIIELISPNKDVDGFHPFNIGSLAIRQPRLRSCTPYGVIKMLKASNIKLEGLDATIRLLERQEDGQWRIKPSIPAAQLMAEAGDVPIPPYLKRESQVSDQERYQTVFAQQSGAVAAPTAGLHFTPELLEELRARGVSIHFITLHVGIGTFRNLREEDLINNRLHSEWYSIPSETLIALRECKRHGGAVFACGTTVTRTLESAYLEFPTYFVLDEDNPLNLRDILSISSYTNIFIREGFTFHVVDGLLTNFHLPKSSLLMLVSAFAGRERVLRAYRHAIASRYRFFSYGDAMLIPPPR